jgi:hypothetical protein
MSRKPSDYFTISLCRFHHGQQHSIGEHSFAAMYQIDTHALAKAFAEQSPKAREIKAIREEQDRAA